MGEEKNAAERLARIEADARASDNKRGRFMIDELDTAWLIERVRQLEKELEHARHNGGSDV